MVQLGMEVYVRQQYQDIIKEGYEKCLRLEEIPGLLKVNKVKPKDIHKTKNIRGTSSWFNGG